MTDRKDALRPTSFNPSPPEGSTDQISPVFFEPLSDGGSKNRKLSLPKILLITSGTALILVLLFLFTARSLTLNVIADGAINYSLDGFYWPFGERLLIQPGEYQLTVTAEGYRAFEKKIVVSKAAAQKLEIPLAPLPGSLQLTTQPSGAKVEFDGVEMGASPLYKPVLEAGNYFVSASMPRYKNWEGEIVVTGRNQEQTVDIALSPDWALIRFSTTPESIFASIDEKPADVSTKGIEVLAGNHVLHLSAPGFVTANLSLSVVAGVDQDLGHINLIPSDATLKLISNPSSATITLDGVFAGMTPLVLPISPAKIHTLKLSKAGFFPHTMNVSLEQGQMAEQTVTLEPELGEVQFNITPTEAELMIDGKSYGAGSRTLLLPAVDQRVEIQLDGYESFFASLQPRPGLPQKLEVSLLTRTQARKARLISTITNSLGQKLILIDPSTETQNPFTLGASRRDPGRRANEVERLVELNRAFYLASTETTNAHFRSYEANHSSGLVERYSLDREQQPVANVTWQQAASFCNWLSLEEGLPPFYKENQGIIIGFNESSTGYRLPSEAEWSFAARVENNQLRRFSWGNEFPPKNSISNLADDASAFVTGRILNGYSDKFVVSAPVGSFPANHRGVYDLGGNVAEWVHDTYQIPSANAELVVDPLGTERGDNYTIRGGSWALSRLSELRLTFRDYGERGRDDLGFRIGRYAE